MSLFCLAIGQDPKELPVAIVNAENNGMACDFSGNFSKECPMTLGKVLKIITIKNWNISCQFWNLQL